MNSTSTSGRKGGVCPPRWYALWAATLGFMLDAMDVLLYVFALQAIRADFGLTNAQAGLVSSATLVASAAGGIVSGILADRIGRRRTLIYTILLYSLASGGAATAQSLTQLVFWRALVGLGLGGEWAAELFAVQGVLAGRVPAVFRRAEGAAGNAEARRP